MDTLSSWGFLLSLGGLPIEFSEVMRNSFLLGDTFVTRKLIQIYMRSSYMFHFAEEGFPVEEWHARPPLHYRPNRRYSPW